ncbi:pyroglutamyl-peptidase I [Ureibacillus thermosphaericus]|uniref:pyroglutamyl-peptidase I n=1 Tax=Ureibacillus thermosphaericus TaxID=51173 RepID=UPI000BBBDA5A|nr:pyroglutamyl-peptidase I [Ureibacillus thermosphaericus]
MKKLFLTGFEPFLDYHVNPTWDIVEKLNGTVIGDYKIVSKGLKVDFKDGIEEFKQALEDIKPDMIISLGIAAGRHKVTPERIAINIKDGDADNQGYQPIDELIDEEGPDAYLTNLPIRAMVNRLLNEGYPAEISNSAGTYLCNNVMYEGLKYATKHNILAGFIHIPMNFELACKHGKYPGWSNHDLLSAVKICLEEAINAT